MQLELLVPHGWQHSSKEFLMSWYGRLGYRVVGRRTLDDTHPHLASRLAAPCDLLIYEKPLAAPARRPGTSGPGGAIVVARRIGDGRADP
jgi:hypothetical protein